MNSYNQTLWAVWGNQLLFIISTILFFDWIMIPFAIIGLYVFGCMSEISLHRYYTHKSYETDDFREKLLRIFAILAGQGATISWVTVHRTHHAYEDQTGDPHSPLYHPWWKIALGLFPKTYKKNLVIDLMKSRSWNYFVWENKWYWIIWTSIWVFSFIVNFWLFYFIVAGSAMWYNATSAINILNHSGAVGERRYEDSVANNSALMNLLTGIGHHNNHHKYPRSYTYGVNGEFDINGLVIKKFFMKNEIK